MSNRSALVAVIIAFLVGGIATLALRPHAPASEPSEASGDSPVRWRMPTAFATHLPALGDNAPWVSERIAAASGGRVRIDVFDPGEIVPALNIVDAVRDAKVPAGYTWLGYDQGKLPASVLFGAVPFGPEPWAFTAWWYVAGGRELAEEIYEPLGLKPILCGIIGPETAGWFREEITSLDDVRGLKIRFAGLGGKVLQELGASVTLLAGGEIFQALEKGAIDATEYSLPNVDQRLGFDRVARFNYFPGWHQPFTAAHMVVGLGAWEALRENDRALIETVCTAGVTHKLARAEALQGAVLRSFEEGPVRTLSLPPDILAELERVTGEILAREARANPDFARVLAHQQNFADEYALWRNLAYPKSER